MKSYKKIRFLLIPFIFGSWYIYVLLIIKHYVSYLYLLTQSLPNLIGQSRKKELDYPVNPPKAEDNDNHINEKGGMEEMKKLFSLLIVSIVSFALFSVLDYPVYAAKEPPAEGRPLPVIKLPIPKNQEAKDYLGIKGEGSFTIPQIKAKVVIIEIFSMYCPYCQKEAPIVNDLYNAIEKNPDLKGKVKIIGIGAGNTPMEVDVFRKKYQIAFPLFPDADYSIHKVCGEVRTPYFIGVKINENGSHEVIYSKLGSIEDANKFLDLILQRSGIKKEGS